MILKKAGTAKKMEGRSEAAHGPKQTKSLFSF
jgi:hypothetical protein